MPGLIGEWWVLTHALKPLRVAQKRSSSTNGKGWADLNLTLPIETENWKAEHSGRTFHPHNSFPWASPRYPLSSRPELRRSAVEGSAVSFSSSHANSSAHTLESCNSTSLDPCRTERVIEIFSESDGENSRTRLADDVGPTIFQVVIGTAYSGYLWNALPWALYWAAVGSLAL